MQKIALWISAEGKRKSVNNTDFVPVCIKIVPHLLNLVIVLLISLLVLLTLAFFFFFLGGGFKGPGRAVCAVRVCLKPSRFA